MNKKAGSLLIIMFAAMAAGAQICNGSLGDPVINVTFGSGSNPGRALTSATNYTYTSGTCPQDGLYTIANSSFGCNNNTWHNLIEDHTPGDNNGYMMLVNASFTPGDFYVDTVKGLCPNTTYEFAAWILNILKTSACNANGIKPNLTFKIQTTDGTVLGSYNTGDIAQSAGPNWQQYGLFFTTPVSVSNIILRLTNNARGGCGNDLVLDDITFRPCGATVKAAISNLAGTTNIDFCQGDLTTITLGASLSIGYVNPGYQWQLSTDSVTWKDITGATSTTYTRSPTAPGNYFYRLVVAEAGNISSLVCRVASNVIIVRMNTNPVINASGNKPFCEQRPMNFQATGGSKYVWSGPRGFSSTLANPQSVASLNSSGTYYVNVTTDRGCSGLDSVIVLVFPKATANAGADERICEGKSIRLQASDAASWLWSPSVGLSSNTLQNPLASPVDSTIYTLNIKDNNGCQASDTIRINVSKKPVAIAGAEIQIFQGQSAVLQGIAKGTNIQFQWKPVTFMSNSRTLTPTVSPTDTITYKLSVISGDGCGVSESTVFIRVFQKVVVPNAFSPNGDGINDVWNIEKLQTYNNAVVTVFNRFGQVLFKSVGYSKKWDGIFNNKPLPFGTYYYTLDLKNGSKATSGWVLIVR